MAELALKVARDQDRTAFAELFDFLAPRVNAYLRKLGLDTASAEEICQETMVILWQKAALFDPAKSSLSTWIFRVARNRRIDHQRRISKAIVDEEDPMLQPEPAPAPDGGIDEERREAAVRSAIAELPPEQYEVVRLAFFLGMAHSQIAEETGLPIGTVKSRIRLAFARLRARLSADASIDID